MSKPIKYNEYEVSFTLKLGPEKVTNIQKLEKTFTEILWGLDVASQIHDAVEAAVGLMVVHDKGRVSHMHLETTPVQIVAKDTKQESSG